MARGRHPGIMASISPQVVWGSHDLCPFLLQFQVRKLTQWELSALSQAGAWGHIEKPKCNRMFLLIVLGKTIEGERVFDLVAVLGAPTPSTPFFPGWAAWKLTLLIDAGADWAYAFMQLNKGALHVPLSNEGHISTLIDGVPSRSTCGHLSQLEVHKLLQCGDQVVYPKGLNGGLELKWFSLPEPPVWDMDALGRLPHEPSPLKVDLSSIKSRNQTSITPPLHTASTSPSSLHSTMEHPSGTTTTTSMAAELQELLPQAMLDTFSSVPGHTILRRPTSAAMGAPPSIGAKDSLSPGEDRLSHAQTNNHLLPGITADVHACWYCQHHPLAVCLLQPLCQKLMRQSMSPPLRSLRLLLAHCQAKYSNFKERWMWPWGDCLPPVPHWTPSTEGWYQTPKPLLRSPRPSTIWDTEATCAAAIREAETTCADQTYTLLWFLEESMQDLECKSIEKERQDHQSLLEACGVALQASPTEAQGGTYVPLAVADGEHALSCPFGYYHPTGHVNHEMQPCNFPSNCDRDTCTSSWGQMTMPFVQPGGSLSEIKVGWKCSNGCNPGGAAPLKVEKQEASGKTPKRKLLGGLFKGHRDCQGNQVGLSSLPQGKVCSGEVPWPDTNFQRNGLGDQSPECRDPWSAVGLG